MVDVKTFCYCYECDLEDMITMYVYLVIYNFIKHS